MSLAKINYVNNETIITAESLNNIQDAIIYSHENGVFSGDLNELYTSGWYWIRCENCLSTPYGDNKSGIFGFLEVIVWQHGTNVLQRFTNYSDKKTFVRSSVNGWQDWINTALLSYPIGSIYQSTSSTSPASLFGGTWEQIQNRFLLAAGSSYSAGATGGAATVTLTTNQIPSHNHQQRLVARTLNDASGSSSATGYNSNIGWWTTMQIYDSSITTHNTGGGQSHNNMPPYLVVYTWKRVS